MEGMGVRETETGIGGRPGTVWEYRIALGVERKNIDVAMDGFGFFGVLGLAGCGLDRVSAKAGGVGLFRAIGGGAAESKDEARVNAVLARELRLESIRLSGKGEGLVVWLHKGKASKSRVEGRDSRSESSSGKRDEGPLEEAFE